MPITAMGVLGPVAGLLRPGNAGSNTAADHIEVFDAALVQLPEPWRTPDEQGRRPVLVRTDAAGATHSFTHHLVAMGVEFSVGAYLHHFDIHRVLAQLPEQAWTPAYQVRVPRAGEPHPVIEPRDGPAVVLADYVRHYNGRRPHRARDLRPPQPTHPAADLSYERIKRRPVLGGLINEYEQAA
jgi:hypothetical protein